MTISELAKIFSGDNRSEIIANALKSEKAEIALRGISGSGLVFTAQAVLQKNQGDYLFIFNDKEEAAYFLNDLEKFQGSGLDVYFFPATYRVPYQVENTDNSNVVLRAEVLKALSDKPRKSRAVVTYPEALSENVITRKQLKSNSFDIKVGETYSISFINELLTEYE
ncbi:MAG: transcription-repair coupling factor, partial [Flavobacteriales bacterium]|nr:transcription-repair coupling factor [Flavobacteriales bacterium]